MVEGLYRGWDELRSVPSGQQSGLRVIVLFTDGASNSVPGRLRRGHRPRPRAPHLRLPEDARRSRRPDLGQPADRRPLRHRDRQPDAASTSAAHGADHWNSTPTAAHGLAPWLPLTSWHTHHRSSGIPTSFPLQTNALTVNGVAQIAARGLRDWNAAAGRYPADVCNINNAARNLVEIIANAARSDTGDYPIRIYTIGMGELVRYKLGTRKEMSESILKRIANDSTSPDFNATQLEGKYYYAKTAADVGPAFQALQNQIIRLSK